jgi:diguanylate cyclase (GGDEF)-like protein
MDLVSVMRRVLQKCDTHLSDDRLAETALVALVEHLGMEYCSVFVREQKFLRCLAGTGFGESVSNRMSRSKVARFEVGAGPVIPEESGVTGVVCRTGQIQYCPDCAQDQRFESLKGHHPDPPHGSLLALPLKDESEVIGVLHVWHRQVSYFDIWQQNGLALFADTLALWLRNSRLFRHLELKVAMRTDALQRSLAESQRLRRRFEHLSTVDELTGLHNRRHFFNEAHRLLQGAKDQEAPLVMVMVDLDKFKKINDTWGHSVGDDVLARVAKALTGELRSGDLLARLGGEEFVILLPGTDRQAAVQFVERLRQRLASISAGPEGTGRHLTASYGITEYTEELYSLDFDDVLDVLYARADKAMYRCKLLGRNRWAIYVPTDEETSLLPRP